MSPTWNSDSSYNSRFENHKNMNWAENLKVPIWFKRKNKNFWDFQVFNFALYIPKIENSEISEIFFISNFDTDCNSRFKNAQKNELRQKLKGSAMI